MTRSAIFLSRDTPGLGGVLPMALNSDASKVYVGRMFSLARDRLNLFVVTLDSTGAVVGTPSRFPDSPLGLPVGGRSTVRLIRVDSSRRKLYVGTSIDLPFIRPPVPPSTEGRVLSVYDLDSSGDPQGPPRVYDVRQAGVTPLTSLALHPTLGLLYLVGGQNSKVAIYNLDSDGWPVALAGEPPIGGEAKYEVAVSEDGDLLYLGTLYGRLEVVSLGLSGMPTGPVQRFDGRVSGVVDDGFFRFRYTPKALYWRPRFEWDDTPHATTAPPVVVWRLDDRGFPMGRPTTSPGLNGSVIAVDGRGGSLWARDFSTFPDAFDPTAPLRRTGAVVMKVPLDAAGQPVSGAGEASGPRFFQEVRAVELAEDGTPVVLTHTRPADPGNQVRGYHVRVTLEDAHPRPASDATIWLQRFGGSLRLEGTSPSAVFSLDDELRDRAGQILFRTGIDKPCDTLTLRFEFFDGDPAVGGALLKEMTDTVAGNFIHMFIPGYGFLADDRTEGIELLSGHARRYLEQARLAAGDGADRPRQFVVSCSHLRGGQGHLEQLRMEAEAMGLLGINTANVESWSQLTPSTIEEELDTYGIRWRSKVSYHPLDDFVRGGSRPHDPWSHLTHFDFYLSRHQVDLFQWARDKVREVRERGGGEREDLVDFKLADEPEWRYPEFISYVSDNPGYLEDFRAFLHETLRHRRLPERFFGRPVDDVLPTSRGLGEPLETRRLFYWTARFFAEQASRAYGRATSALEEAVGHPLNVAVNLNNFIGAWYSRGSSSSHDAGTGSVDWFISGRLNSHMLWCGPDYSDRDAQMFSYFGNGARSTAMLGRRGSGGYVVGRRLGQHPAGAAYKVLSLVGHGAKHIDFYTFGPTDYFGNVGDSWSENLAVYKPIAEALRLLGRAERLLFPGQPSHGRVALHMPNMSALWDDNPGMKVYQQEIIALHFALVHGGYTVDFIGDEDLDERVLSERRYTTVYVTGPNVPSAGLTGISNWLNRRGRMLVVTLGAGVADEYGTASGELDAVLGLRPRAAIRIARYSDDPALRFYDESLVPVDAAFGADRVPIRGPFSALEPAGAAVAATFSDGRAAITRHSPRGASGGVAIAYGFFPGFQYESTIDQALYSPAPVDPHRLPRGWGGHERRLALAPVAIASTPKDVSVDRDLVEACRLNSSDGIAIVLLNWSDEPIERLSVEVQGAGRFRRATTAQRVSLTVRTRGSDVIVEMPLRYVDVLMLEP